MTKTVPKTLSRSVAGVGMEGGMVPVWQSLGDSRENGNLVANRVVWGLGVIGI